MTKSLMLILCCITLAYMQSAAQQISAYSSRKELDGKLRRSPVQPHQRMHIGYTFHNVFADQKRTVYKLDNAETITEIEESRTVRTIGGYAFSLGSFFTLTRFNSNIAALALSTDFTYSYLPWEELDSGFAYRAKPKEHKATDFTIQMGAPISLDLKLGADAGPSFNHKWSASIGGGISPVIAFTSRSKKIFKEAVNITQAAVPFIKTEFGMRTGVLMKVRMLMMFGGPEYIQKGQVFNSFSGNYSLTGKFSTQISLLVYPFSYQWPEYGWWQP